MQQLPLPVRLRTSSVFASYYAGRNHDVVECLLNKQFGASPFVFLYGPAGTGKTHLLQAMCVEAGNKGVSASYLSHRDLSTYGVELLLSYSRSTLLCIDDVDLLLTDRQWNHGLFTLHRELDEHQGKLIMSASQPPASYTVPLADLGSRLMASTVLRLKLLDEAEQLHALQLHASQRGLVLPDETAEYMLRRLPRNMQKLCQYLDELDIASLVEKRNLSIPFVKRVLDELSAGEQNSRQ